MRAYVAHPKQTPARAIIVFQEAFGVNAHIRDVTERLSREGYLAIAPELFHRTAPGFEEDYKNFEGTKPHTAALTDAGLEADARAAFDWLTAQGIKTDQISSIGFCMGGRVSFIANSVLPLRSAISFYGGGIAQSLSRVPSLHGPMLLFWGGMDKHIGPDQRRATLDALQTHEKSATHVVFSDANHGFFCDARGVTIRVQRPWHGPS